MLTKLFSIYDAKAEFYLPVFQMKSAGEATRAFVASSKNNQTDLGLYPMDFTLVEIGTFDDSNAFVTMYEHKKIIGTALELQALHKQPEPSA